MTEEERNIDDPVRLSEEAHGNLQKAASELKEVLRINQATRGADQSPPSPVRSLLFSVRPPVNAPVVGNP